MDLEAVLRTGRQVPNEYMLTPISSFDEAHCAKIIDDVFHKATEEILDNIDRKFTKKIEKHSDLVNDIPIANSDDVDWKQIWKKYPSIDDTKAVLNLFNHPDLIMSKLKLICDSLPEVDGSFRFKLPFETDNALKLVSSTMSGYDQDHLCDFLWLNTLKKFNGFKYLLMFEKGVPARPLNKLLMFKSTFQKVVQVLKICELVDGNTVESLRLTCDVAKLIAAIEGNTINGG